MCVYIIALIILLLVIAALGGVLGARFLCTPAAEKSAAPFFPTPARAIQEALRAAGLKPGEAFYDLGAGTGKVLVIAEREFGARATGFEISIIFYCIARINLFIRRSRAKLLAKNFFNADLRNVDVVFCFLAIRTMQKMEDKLKKELKPGARVIVYAFPLPGFAAMNTITVRGEWKMFLYRID
jgi:SAM-dependent methyltransferase